MIELKAADGHKLAAYRAEPAGQAARRRGGDPGDLRRQQPHQVGRRRLRGRRLPRHRARDVRPRAARLRHRLLAAGDPGRHRHHAEARLEADDARRRRGDRARRRRRARSASSATAGAAPCRGWPRRALERPRRARCPTTAAACRASSTRSRRCRRCATSASSTSRRRSSSRRTSPGASGDHRALLCGRRSRLQLRPARLLQRREPPSSRASARSSSSASTSAEPPWRCRTANSASPRARSGCAKRKRLEADDRAGGGARPRARCWSRCCSSRSTRRCAAG